MSDARLADLRRAWQASGSVDDHAAYLREAVRSGELRRDQLELAALCGHPAARLASDTPQPIPETFQAAIELLLPRSPWHAIWLYVKGLEQGLEESGYWNVGNPPNMSVVMEGLQQAKAWLEGEPVSHEESILELGALAATWVEQGPIRPRFLVAWILLGYLLPLDQQGGPPEAQAIVFAAMATQSQVIDEEFVEPREALQALLVELQEKVLPSPG